MTEEAEDNGPEVFVLTVVVVVVVVVDVEVSTVSNAFFLSAETAFLLVTDL